MPSQHILLPYNGLPREMLALQAACDLAKARRAKLSVVCLVETSLSLSIDAPDIPGVAEANRALDEAEAIAAKRGVRVSASVYPCRDAGHAIVTLCARLGCSHIIMEIGDTLREGTPPLSSDVEHVLANAPCEVWISRIAE